MILKGDEGAAVGVYLQTGGSSSHVKMSYRARPSLSVSTYYDRYNAILICELYADTQTIFP